MKGIHQMVSEPLAGGQALRSARGKLLRDCLLLIGGGLLPVSRWGQPEDIANAVVSLASGAFRYTTGQSIDVDGGFHIRRL